MRRPLLAMLLWAIAAPVMTRAQGAATQPVKAEAGAGDLHPNLSGVWSYAVDRAPRALKIVVDGVTTVRTIDQSARYTDPAAVRNALPSTAKPEYKAEYLEKVKHLADHESKLDPVFYCGSPGVPRIGPPRKIVQLPAETIFLYEDISGDPYRIVPTDNRGHRADANPSHNGDSVGKWEGNVFVVDVRNFVDDTWIGEEGYFHSSELRVIERLWKEGGNLLWQATVEDPVVLVRPWVMPPRLLKPSTDSLEESPKCVETDGPRLLNDDHHIQR